MTEKMGLLDTGIDISNDEMSKFMAERPDSYACPICQCTSWLGMTDGTGRTAGITWVSPEGNLEMTPPVRILTLFCGQCGFVRAHQIDMLKTYLRSLEEKPE